MIFLNNPYGIKRNGRTVFWKAWFHAGIATVRDIINHETGKPYEYVPFKRKYRLDVDFLRYNGIVQSIPKEWKKSILQNLANIEQNLTENCISKLLKTKEVAKTYYRHFLHSCRKSEKKSEAKWESDIRIQEPSWTSIYEVPFQCTTDSRIQEFQFLINRRILWTNDLLKKANVIQNSRCSFCFDYTETIEHLLFECRTSHNLWLSLIEHLNIKGIYPSFEYNLPNIIFGLLPVSNENLGLNCIILLTKKFIYNSRCKNIEPTLQSLISYLKFNIKLEKMGKFEGRELDKFNLKWQNFGGLLD